MFSAGLDRLENIGGVDFVVARGSDGIGAQVGECIDRDAGCAWFERRQPWWPERTLRVPLTDIVSIGSHVRILTSLDGTTWTPRTSGTTTAFLSGIAWDGDQFVVVGDTLYLTSPDGASWTPHAWGALPAAAAIAWNGHDFVAVGDHGAILTSTDGLTWTQVPALTNHPLTAVAAGGFPNVQFVAVSNFGDLIYSSDSIFVDSFEALAGEHPSLHVAVLPRNR